MDERASPMHRWESLLEEQSAIFKRTTDENELLRLRVIELERELGVWKLGFTKADEDNATLKGSNAQLESILGSLKNDNPLLLCLIDGDGHIFKKELITQGRSGGRQAAMLLTKGLTDYTARATDTPQMSRAQVWLTVFCNKTGLIDTLVNQDICTKEQFKEFCFGFNQAAPLFSILDVGPGKESADSKIKEYLRVFTRFPQTSFVFFGGGHDNGYTSSLTLLENEGLMHKIVLLRGYKAIALELRNLNLPEITVDGVFMPRKLSNPFTRNKGQLPEHGPAMSAPGSPKKTSIHSTPSSSGDEPRYLEPGVVGHINEVLLSFLLSIPLQPLHKQTPPPCTFFYLSACKQGAKCTYGHDYILTPENYHDLRENGKKAPCPMINRNKVCPSGDNCPSGHFCPRGENCAYYKRRTCKFVGHSMHTKPSAGSKNAGTSSSPSEETRSESTDHAAF
ncbi:hypothetical protein B0H16DRAFT_28332 [Mycena metata]|uniref:C3H1-type domain-containing protein n=1 Tax=Mycena metata TaxID=1033252 RepID=A0AAD7KIA5_9AGAR|nr:hypothetical protein B0H16DRAFT_28332 [Mycena metata]